MDIRPGPVQGVGFGELVEHASMELVPHSGGLQGA
jgi:hypothetical protein